MELLNDDILTEVVKPRKSDSHKGTYGKVLIIGGNEQYGGAAILASSAAVYSGAGLVTVQTAEKNHAALHARLPEAMVVKFDEKLDLANFNVILIGCGLGVEENSRQILRNTLSNLTEEQILILDGSALTILAEENLAIPFLENTIYTPHQMELERLSKLKISAQNDKNIANFARQIKGILVAKSNQTTIFDRKSAYRLMIGTPAQATGGMGDTLAGMIAGFLAQFPENPTKTVAAATYLHSKIASQIAEAQHVVLPHQIIAEIPKNMKNVYR